MIVFDVLEVLHVSLSLLILLLTTFTMICS